MPGAKGPGPSSDRPCLCARAARPDRYNAHMRQALILHPDSLCLAATQIDVEVARPRADRLVLSYVVTGKIGDLRMPPVMASARGDELWRHTCFEAFVRASAGRRLLRIQLCAVDRNGRPIGSAATEAGCVWRARSARRRSRCNRAPNATRCRPRWSWIALSGLPRDASWRLGLSAVIEDTSGRKSYWALAHPPGKPDFHHADCFAHELSSDGAAT